MKTETNGTKKTKLIFLRHGKTAYTGKFPDLTEDGVAQITKASEEIAGIVGDSKSVQIISSPLPRALGTADIIARRILRQGEFIKEEPQLRCMDFIEPAGAEALWRSFGASRAVDIAYPYDPRFEAGDVVEPRSAIQRRFFRYLGQLFEQFVDEELPEFMIHTGHFELLWWLARQMDETEPLIHGELIVMELSKGSVGTNLFHDKHVHVMATFRGRSWQPTIELPSNLFRHQF